MFDTMDIMFDQSNQQCLTYNNLCTHIDNRSHNVWNQSRSIRNIIAKTKRTNQLTPVQFQTTLLVDNYNLNYLYKDEVPNNVPTKIANNLTKINPLKSFHMYKIINRDEQHNITKQMYKHSIHIINNKLIHTNENDWSNK